MYLLIDNSADNQISLHYSLNTGWAQKDYEPESGQGVLFYIHQLLLETDRSFADLAGIAVLVGKGRFTSTRIAVTVANTLAYALRIPVIAVREPDDAGLEEKIAQAPLGIYVSARYSAEANVGNVKIKN